MERVVSSVSRSVQESEIGVRVRVSSVCRHAYVAGSPFSAEIGHPTIPFHSVNWSVASPASNAPLTMAPTSCLARLNVPSPSKVMFQSPVSAGPPARFGGMSSREMVTVKTPRSGWTSSSSWSSASTGAANDAEISSASAMARTAAPDRASREGTPMLMTGCS